MSAMSELHIENMNLEGEWLELLVSILEADGYEARIRKPVEGPDNEQEWEAMRWFPDLEINPVGQDEILAVEFKMFRWKKDWRHRINDAVAFVENLTDRFDYVYGIVILSLELDDNERDSVGELVDGRQVAVWDFKKLREIAAGDTKLLERLEQLASETDIDDRSFVPRRPDVLGRGSEIAQRLRATPSGKSGWKAFEEICHEAIYFLFGRELQKLVSQKVTYDNLHRMDLIGRIKSEKESFWSMLVSDFSSRYVVFEAKNYSDPIGQQAIDITAKYLFRAGLRTVAVVIAREGASQQAMVASAGHLREDRKFIMVINMNDMCKMLEGADAGDPPENILFERMDETLMAIGR